MLRNICLFDGAFEVQGHSHAAISPVLSKLTGLSVDMCTDMCVHIHVRGMLC